MSDPTGSFSIEDQLLLARARSEAFEDANKIILDRLEEACIARAESDDANWGAVVLCALILSFTGFVLWMLLK